MVHVRFQSPQGKVIEALCTARDLGLLYKFEGTSFTPGATKSVGRNAVAWDEISTEDMDLSTATDRVRTCLNIEGITWRHAQSEHFVVHFERAIFAKKVGRMAEFYYDFIAEDLDGVTDWVDGRSHIFVFRNERKWKMFLDANPRAMQWAFAMVQGPAMYLQQADSAGRSADVLAHEMTHLILNRFFKHDIPTWLNEGMAEWYEEFAYSAFKGTKKSKRTQFRHRRYDIAPSAVINAQSYPSEPRAISAYYETSKFIVAYLRLEWPGSAFIGYIHDVMNGADALESLDPHFDIPDVDTLEDGFTKFVN